MSSPILLGDRHVALVVGPLTLGSAGNDIGYELMKGGSRRVTAEWVGAIAAVVATLSGIVFGVMQLNGGDSSGASKTAESSPAKTTEETRHSAPTLSLSPEEQALIGLIPNHGVAASCEPLRDGADAPGEIAEIRCPIPGGGTVWYQRYENGGQAKVNWDKRQQGYKQGDGNPWGCDAATNVFYYEDSYGSEGLPDGWLRCYILRGTPWIEWTDTTQRVYAAAKGRDGDWRPLREAWGTLGPSD
jgi:hypothetical protein